MSMIGQRRLGASTISMMNKLSSSKSQLWSGHKVAFKSNEELEHRWLFVGMFLFAKLVMENLHAQETRMELLNEIDVYPFPEGLGDA